MDTFKGASRGSLPPPDSLTPVGGHRVSYTQQNCFAWLCALNISPYSSVPVTLLPCWIICSISAAHFFCRRHFRPSFLFYVQLDCCHLHLFWGVRGGGRVISECFISGRIRFAISHRWFNLYNWRGLWFVHLSFMACIQRICNLCCCLF